MHLVYLHTSATDFDIFQESTTNLSYRLHIMMQAYENLYEIAVPVPLS